MCVNIPPRHGKSQLVSIFYPAWFLGRNPDKKVMMVSHTTDLAVDFGRKVRNLISDDMFKAIFPTVSLASDSKSAGRWNTSVGGEYYACGVGSALAGRGADLLLIDDPHSEQDVINGNFSVFEKAYEWYTFGARTRLMPGGRVAIIQTRWHMDDLTGRVIKDMTQNDRSDQFEVIEFPAILEIEDEETDKIVEKPLWPEFFDLEASLLSTTCMMSLSISAHKSSVIIVCSSVIVVLHLVKVAPFRGRLVSLFYTVFRISHVLILACSSSSSTTSSHSSGANYHHLCLAIADHKVCRY